MRTSTLIAALGLTLALVACGDDSATRAEAPAATPDAGPRKGAKSKARAEAEDGAAAEEEGPVTDDLLEYAYNPIGKRDPFRSFFRNAGTEGIAPPTRLQRYEVDQYRLVGIVWGISNPRAMVQDPENMGHVIEVGTYIGKNWGKVTQINSSAVVITEEYQTIDGELVTNQIMMELPVEEPTQ